MRKTISFTFLTFLKRPRNFIFIALIVATNTTLLSLPFEEYRLVMIIISTIMAVLFWRLTSVLPKENSGEIIIGTTYGLELKKKLRKNAANIWVWFFLTGFCLLISSIFFAVGSGILMKGDGLPGLKIIFWGLLFLVGTMCFAYQLAKSLQQREQMKDFSDATY